METYTRVHTPIQRPIDVVKNSKNKSFIIIIFKRDILHCVGLFWAPRNVWHAWPGLAQLKHAPRSPDKQPLVPRLLSSSKEMRFLQRERASTRMLCSPCDRSDWEANTRCSLSFSLPRRLLSSPPLPITYMPPSMHVTSRNVSPPFAG